MENFEDLCKKIGGQFSKRKYAEYEALVCKVKDTELEIIPEHTVSVKTKNTEIDITSSFIKPEMLPHFPLIGPVMESPFSRKIFPRRKRETLRIHIWGGHIDADSDGKVEIDLDINEAVRSVVATKLGLEEEYE